MHPLPAKYQDWTNDNDQCWTNVSISSSMWSAFVATIAKHWSAIPLKRTTVGQIIPPPFRKILYNKPQEQFKGRPQVEVTIGLIATS